MLVPVGPRMVWSWVLRSLGVVVGSVGPRDGVGPLVSGAGAKRVLELVYLLLGGVRSWDL